MRKIKKTGANIKCTLSVGISVFDDPYRLEAYDNREAYGEDRFVTIGMDKNWIHFMSVTP